jgi:hypothetical protein
MQDRQTENPQQPVTEKPSVTEKKPSTPEQEEAKKKREALEEISRQYNWDNLKGAHFKIQRPEMLGQEEADQNPNLAVLSNHSLPMKLTPGPYDLVYEQDKKERRMSILVKLNEDGGHSISPAYNPDPDKKDFEKNFNNCYQQIMRAYSIGLGVNRITLDFPNAERRPEVIDLNNVVRMLKVAKDEKMAVSFGPVLVKRLSMLDPNSKKDMKLRNEIYELHNIIAARLRNNTELDAKQAEGTNAYNIKGMNEAVNNVKRTGAELEKAVGEKVPVDEFKEKMKALLDARSILEKKVNNIQEDIKSHPLNNKVLYEKYDRELAKAQAEITKVRNALEAIKLNVVGDGVEYEGLLKKLKTLEDKTAKATQEARNEGKEPAERANIKIKDLSQAKDALTHSVAGLSTNNADGFNQASSALENAMKIIDTEIKRSDLSPTEKEKYRSALEEVNEKIKSIEADVKNNVVAISDPALKADVERQINLHAEHSDRILDSLATPEERETARFEKIKQEPEADAIELVGKELERINERMLNLNHEIEALVKKPAPLSDTDEAKCENLLKEVEKEEKAFEKNNGKWETFIQGLNPTNPSLQKEQDSRKDKMTTLQELKRPLEEKIEAKKAEQRSLRPGAPA